MPEPADLLSTETVVSYLIQRGLIGAGSAYAVALGGGVSNVVLAVHTGENHIVVKQSLPRLRVADEWLAKRERVLTEAAALQWAATLTPGAVPTVLDVDPGSCTISIVHAPVAWRNWKDLLLAGEADSSIATRLGEVLAAWHSTPLDLAARHRFDDVEAFEQLRVDPYYRTLMQRRPDLAHTVLPFVDRMLASRHALVHGDFSPKNVLVGSDGLWVVDFEVAHLGDPAFDLAFLLNHLALKALHRPADFAAYRRCALAFWDTYCSGVPHDFAGPPAYVFGHMACLMLARVDGKSPAEYLTQHERNTARSLGDQLLAAPPSTLTEVWNTVHQVIIS